MDPFGVFFAFSSIIFAATVVLTLLVNVPIAYICWSCVQRLPREYRKLSPGFCWLLLIPLVNLVVNFFVFPKLSESYEQFFADHGRRDVGDANSVLGWVYCVTCLGAYVLPCVATIASFVIVFIYLNRMLKLRDQVRLAQQSAR